MFIKVSRPLWVTLDIYVITSDLDNRRNLRMHVNKEIPSHLPILLVPDGVLLPGLFFHLYLNHVEKYINTRFFKLLRARRLNLH